MVADGADAPVSGLPIGDLPAGERMMIRMKVPDVSYANAVACELAYIDNGVGNLSRDYLRVKKEMVTLRSQLAAAALVASNAARDLANAEKYIERLRDEHSALTQERDDLDTALTKTNEKIKILDSRIVIIVADRDSAEHQAKVYGEALRDTRGELERAKSNLTAVRNDLDRERRRSERAS